MSRRTGTSGATSKCDLSVSVPAQKHRQCQKNIQKAAQFRVTVDILYNFRLFWQENIEDKSEHDLIDMLVIITRVMQV